jgi:tetratricopeptide (TPR) repeat protein
MSLSTRARPIVIAAAFAAGLAVLGRVWAQAADPVVTLRVIVVTSADAAQTILAQLKAGESFAMLARSSSTAPSANDGGWLGKQRVADLRPEVRAALQGLSAGQLTGVIRIPTGFAVFRVEPDDPGESASAVDAALAAAGSVRFVADLSGFTEARQSLEMFEKPAEWNLTPRATCDARMKSLAATRTSLETYLAPANAVALAGRAPLDVMQLHVGLAQLAAYEGRMADSIAGLQRARAIAATDVKDAVPRADESLGIACLHKAEMDSGLQAQPGDTCLLAVHPRQPLRQPAEARAAIDYFQRYLSVKPDDLEVRWLLNLAYMEIGDYPDKVPPQYLIPATAFQSKEDIGRFRDVAALAGLVHVGSAGGVVVEDLRGNGRFDVVTSSMDSCAAMQYLGNNGDGTFTDRTATAGLAGQLGGLNIVPGDFNNDGCQDILVLRGGWENLPQRKSLLRNTCDGTFTDVTVAAGLGEPTTTQTAVWVDYDNDGWLDLFAGNETGPAQLFHNTGHGTFAEVAKAAGVDRTSFTKGVTAIDYDNDRYPDLYVSNYGETNFLYHNNRNGTFTEVAAAARVRGTPTGFATWFFDYDNDGWPDLFVTSYVGSVDEIARSYLGLPRNGTTMKLYRNLGDGTFRDVTAEANLARVHMPMGSNFGDVDNDGYLDMYLGTGQPSYAATVGSLLLHNKDGRTFVDVSASSGTAELHKGHGVAFADLDSDGDEDIVFLVGGATPGDRHALRLFENPGHGNDWIALKLEGVKTTRTAVGARIKVTVQTGGGTRAIYRTVGTGGSFGASPLLQHIGLGNTRAPVDIEIWWPTSDTRQRFTGVSKNQWLHVRELDTAYTLLKRAPVRLGGAVKAP